MILVLIVALVSTIGTLIGIRHYELLDGENDR